MTIQRKIVCIECPNGCVLQIDVDEGKVVNVEGNKCDKGFVYAESEMLNPLRAFTSSVLTEGLKMRMVSVKTDKAIPKSRLFEAMSEVRRLRIRNTTTVGQIIKRNFLEVGVNLIATRESK